MENSPFPRLSNPVKFLFAMPSGPNRRKRFLAGLLAGYSAFGANLVYTLVSVPLALHYLSKSEFGLWALVTQIGSYLVLLDLGMTGSVARFLADHKDTMEDGEYGSILRTGRLVFAVQSLTILLIALAGAWLLPFLLDLPSALIPAFKILLLGQGAIQSVSLFLRAESSPLWAHQRVDVTHWATSANLLTSLGAMAGGLGWGWGVYSFLFGAALGSLWSWFLPPIFCYHSHFIPTGTGRGDFRWNLFLRMLKFGRDILLMQLGGLLCSASPIILVTKILGLEAAAAYSIGTKALTMGQQVLGRIVESAAPGLTELYVRGERGRFATRFYQMTAISIALALTLGILLMGSNRIFVSVWTQGKVEWSSWGDLLIGAVLISTVASRCFQGAFGMTGELIKIRHLSMLEGILLVLCSLALKGWGGVLGILGVVLLVNIFISLIGGGVQVARAIPAGFGGPKIVVFVLAVYSSCAFASWWVGHVCASPAAPMITTIFLAMASGLFISRKLIPFFQDGV